MFTPTHPRFIATAHRQWPFVTTVCFCALHKALADLHEEVDSKVDLLPQNSGPAWGATARWVRCASL
jgi:hypothetical protein